MHRHIARRTQYALPVAEKPSFENRPRGCVILSPWCDPVNPHDLAHVLWVGFVLYTDPAHPLTAAGEELDDLDHDLSVDELSYQRSGHFCLSSTLSEKYWIKAVECTD